MKKLNSFIQLTCIGFALAVAFLPTAFAQTNSFTFQGKLTDNSLAANGPYDMVLRLFDSSTGGIQIGSDLVFDDVTVQGGLFTVSLDFGPNAFTSGEPRFVEISIRPGASTGAFTELAPRQEITSSPFAIKSRKADEADTAASAANADNAVNAANAANAAQLGGIAADQYVVSTDPRMSDARPPAPGSTNYIQNSTTATNGSFNISGTGRADSLSATTVSANVFQSRGFAVVRALGSTTLLGRSGPIDDSTLVNASNTVVGTNAGTALTSSAQRNAFFGSNAGFDNVGSDNAFFGDRSGGFQSGASVGSRNSFFGSASGNNISGSLGNDLTLVGFNADVAGSPIFNATAIGSNAFVTQSNSVVLGSVLGVNGAPATVNVGIGINAPAHRLHVVGNTRIDGSAFVDGDLGLGTTAPAQRLHVVGGALVNGAVFVTGPRLSTPVGNTLSLSSESTFDAIQSFNNKPLAINPAGNNVGIGTNDPTARLDVNGVVRVRTLGSAGSESLCRNASGQISSCSSSLRYKTNIDRFGFGVDLIRQLRPITFDWINGGMKDLGLGAEDVAAIEPLLVNYNEKGEVEGVKYDRIGVVLVNAVKEQQEQIASQENEIKELKRQLESQRESHQKEIAELRALICSVTPAAGICSSPKQP